jgi:hypothetical protein
MRRYVLPLNELHEDDKVVVLNRRSSVSTVLRRHEVDQLARHDPAAARVPRVITVIEFRVDEVVAMLAPLEMEKAPALSHAEAVTLVCTKNPSLGVAWREEKTPTRRELNAEASANIIKLTELEAEKDRTRSPAAVVDAVAATYPESYAQHVMTAAKRDADAEQTVAALQEQIARAIEEGITRGLTAIEVGEQPTVRELHRKLTLAHRGLKRL